MPSIETVKTKLGNVRPHTRKVFEEICSLWDLYFVWGIGASGEHKEGRALDFMVFDDGTVQKPGPMRPWIGDAIANYLWEHRKRLGVWYVIWNRRIISIRDNSYGKAGNWNPYTGSNPHIDHVHVSFLNDPPPYVPPEDDELAGKADEILKRIAKVEKDIAEARRALGLRANKLEAEHKTRRKEFTDVLKNVQQQDPWILEIKETVLGLAEQVAGIAAAVDELRGKCCGKGGGE